LALPSTGGYCICARQVPWVSGVSEELQELGFTLTRRITAHLDGGLTEVMRRTEHGAPKLLGQAREVGSSASASFALATVHHTRERHAGNAQSPRKLSHRKPPDAAHNGVLQNLYRD